jgi:hypothetical protein
MPSFTFWIPRFTPILFLLPGLGLLFQAVTSATLAERLLGLALTLFCPELARMAQVDLDNIAVILERSGHSPINSGFAGKVTGLISQLQLASSSAQPPDSELCPEPIEKQADLAARQDSRLSHFYKVTLSTIALEVVGFHLALLSLQWGALMIIFSQLWFNMLAAVQLFPYETPAVTPFGIAERQAVLAANILGFGLLCCWPVQSAQVWLALGLLVLIALFLAIKYVVPKFESR